MLLTQAVVPGQQLWLFSDSFKGRGPLFSPVVLLKQPASRYTLEEWGALGSPARSIQILATVASLWAEAWPGF